MFPIIKNCSLVILCIISFIASWQIAIVDFQKYHGDVADGVNITSQSASSVQATKSAEPVETEHILIVDSLSTNFPRASFHSSQRVTNDPGFEKQWAFNYIQAQIVPQTTTRNSQILVAVLDTGIDRDHEDLDGKIVGDVNLTKSTTPYDMYGHGTHVAGIIAANDNNNIGVVGLAEDSRLLNIKVADDGGKCDIVALADGIMWAINNGASVINISVGLKESSPRLEGAVKYAWGNGAVIVAAAGNDASEFPVYPALYENCIAVTAIQPEGKLAPLANHGAWVDVAAPGFNIYSTLPNSSYGYKHGTSFATAYVSGLAALLFPLATDTNGNGRLNDEVRQAIESGCYGIGLEGTGRGRINVINSLVEITKVHESLP